jgi:multiple sugar transport system permease protein
MAVPIKIARAAPAPRTLFGRRVSRMVLGEAISGYLFAMPWLLGLLFWYIGPIVSSLYLSFNDYFVIKPPKWIGTANYVKAFTGDDQFWPSLGRTFRYALQVVPPSILGSLFLAILLNQALRGTSIYRTCFFLPHLTPIVAMAILWKWLLHTEVGPVNYLLSTIGLPMIPWLSSQKWALTSLGLIALWGSVGGNQMLIFLASLQGVPQELLEAAEIDGAGRWRKILNVTLPMISPAIFFNLVLGIIGALRVFALAFVGTAGGPGWSTTFYGLQLYRHAFQYFRMGYASALAWILAAILFFFTYVQMQASRRWVYYASEGEEG